MDTLRFQLTTRVEFERLVQIDPDTLTDLERAARFLYLQRTAFGGKVSGRNFGVDRARGGRFNLTTLEPMLEDLHSRLSGVVIECLDWSAFIPRYDSADTLFYIDPPYWGCEDDYGKAMFARSDFQRLAELLVTIRGRFILSLNDLPEVRSTFGAFELIGDWLKHELRQVLLRLADKRAGGRRIVQAGQDAEHAVNLALGLDQQLVGQRLVQLGES